jgi:hypothetical protein
MDTLLILGLCAFLPLTSRAFETGGATDITAVSGKTSKDYIRTRLPNGRFLPEEYAFGKGGEWTGDKADFSIDTLTFLDVAHSIALPLASQGYLPSRDPRTARLLIMVYWGTTRAPEHASTSSAYERAADLALPGVSSTPTDSTYYVAMLLVDLENKQRDRVDFQNAQMLGYDGWWADTSHYKGTFLQGHRQDIIDELEDDRYFVVLMAYDFQLLWREKKHKLLWETRFSIPQRRHEFNRDLPAMAQYASKYFGQDSGGLVHGEVPFGRVEIGEVKSLGAVPGK